MELSVLIAVYNAEKYIGRCLESLLNQDLPPEKYEILLIDDGSIDGSAEIVEKYTTQHPQIKLFKEKNKGLYVQRNKLLSLATGQYIYMMDADDYLANHSLNHIFNFALKNNLDIIGFGTELTIENDFIDLPKPISQYPSPQIMSGKEYMAKNKYMRDEVWWFILKNRLIKDNHLTFKEGKFHGDVIFTLKAFLNAEKFAFFDAPVYKYFQSGQSIMRNNSEKHMLKLIDSGKFLIENYSNLLKEIIQNNREDILLHNNLKFKLEQYVYFLMMRMIKAGYSYKRLKPFLMFFAKVDAYPLSNLKGGLYDEFKYSTFKKIYNSKLLLSLFIPLRKFINQLR